MALDRSAGDARPFIEAAAARHPSLIDTEHRLADLYGIVNVPTLIWIDEQGRIQEAWTKVTVVLLNRQIVFLDRLAANIRAQSGAAISRAQLLRSLVDAVADADIDLTSSTSEADLKTTVLARLGRYRLGS